MQQVTTLFLKLTVIFIGITVLALCIFFNAPYGESFHSEKWGSKSGSFFNIRSDM